MKTFSSYSIKAVKETFQLEIRRNLLFENLAVVEPGALLLENLERSKLVSLRTEKALSELVIAPVLMEIVYRNRELITLFSGESLDVDRDRGLIGEYDFALSLNPDTYLLEAPIFALVEAKKQDIEARIPQCIAQMVGADIWNNREGHPLDAVFGCVTTGNEWLFLKLQGNQIFINNTSYFIDNVPVLLGALQSVVNHFRKNHE